MNTEGIAFDIDKKIMKSIEGKMKKIFYIFLTILLVSLFSQNVYAQEQDKDSGKLHFMIAP
jgi:hypothetical protein